MKKTALAVALMLGAALALGGCPKPAPPEVAPFVDIERYMGTWYEIASYPQFFQRGLVAVSATYTLREDGTVAILNRGLKEDFGGEESTIEGTARVVDETTNAKLEIRFKPFPANLFKAQYWILEVGEDYDHAVVSGPDRDTLWILYREREMPRDLYDAILARLTQQGYDVSKLKFMPQP